jgi:hypothetical protein
MTHSPYEPPESIPIEELNAAHERTMRARAALTILVFLAFVIVGAAATYYYSAKTFPNTAMRVDGLVDRATPLGAMPITEPPLFAHKPSRFRSARITRSHPTDARSRREEQQTRWTS